MYGLIEIFLFCGVICYFFNLRPNNMVDVLSTRLQGLYAKWDSLDTKTDITRNAEPAATRYSLDGFRRGGHQLFQRRKIQDRDQSRKLRERSLLKIKETEPLMPALKQKTSFLQHCCNTCTPASRDSLVNAIVKQQQPYGVNVLLVKSSPTLLSKVFSCISYLNSTKKFTYPMVTQTVLNDEKLSEPLALTARETADNEGCSEEKAFRKARARARSILLRMESRCSNTLLKIVAWLLYKLLPCVVRSAVVLPSQIELLKKADETGLPLVLLPLHRSHLDYIMLSFVMVVHSLRNPLIAAGDNLNIPFFGWLLKGLGAFYIKRRIDPVAGRRDFLYRAILQTYIMESLRVGHNLEFFVEGGRTRTGKPCMPKSGILSVIVDAYMDGTIEDALLIPVAINYDRLVDGNFVREQLGQPKKMETFASTIRGMWSTLRGNYGVVKIDFCQPFSLREMIKAVQAQHSKLEKLTVKPPSERPLKYSMSNSSLYGTDVIVEEHRQLVDSIARHVVHDSSKSMPIMSTNIVAFILLNSCRYIGCTLGTLVEQFESIRFELEFNDKDVGFCGENVDIVKHALDILGPELVTYQRRENDETKTVDSEQFYESKDAATVKATSDLSSVIELSYYSNTLLVHYVVDSVVVTALCTELRSGANDENGYCDYSKLVNYQKLIERALKLCDILKYEFIFCRPCQSLNDVIQETIQNLTHSGVISRMEQPYLADELWSKRYATNFDDSSDEEYSREREIKKIEYEVSTMQSHRDRIRFLSASLQPLINTYVYSASNLTRLVGRTISEQELVKEVLTNIKTSLDEGELDYGESLCVDPIKNSLKLFEKWNVLEVLMHEKTKMFSLKKEYDTDVATKSVYDTIAVFKSRAQV